MLGLLFILNPQACACEALTPGALVSFPVLPFFFCLEFRQVCQVWGLV